MSNTHTKKHNKRTGTRSSELVFASTPDGQEYAEIIAPKGNCRFEATIISNGETVNAPLRGKLTHGRSKQLITKGDIVLLVKDIGSGYIIDFKYSPEEVKRLQKAGQLAQIVETVSANSGVTVAFSSDVISVKNETIEINDDVIANL